ncbi:Uncharacterized protein APZ42_027904 [Daphnia magna]|uniref:Uncharacterized protein n=1 Tax=Daphnia magna TaxID=35525 RepID=A0A164QZ02_9CRUS|nr:Uncharacterized protein APZ42_027904 [Daphnia magna]
MSRHAFDGSISVLRDGPGGSFLSDNQETFTIEILEMLRCGSKGGGLDLPVVKFFVVFQNS